MIMWHGPKNKAERDLRDIYLSEQCAVFRRLRSPVVIPLVSDADFSAAVSDYSQRVTTNNLPKKNALGPLSESAGSD